MVAMSASIEEQFADSRSDHIAYKLTLSNLSRDPVRILTINPRIPSGAQLIEVIDSDIEEIRSRRSSLISELEDIIFDFLAVSSEAYRKKVAESMRSIAATIFTALGILKLYFYLFQGNNIYAKEITRALGPLRFKIVSAADAQAAYDRWLATDTTSEYAVVKSVFEAKKEQLFRLEQDMNEDQRESLAIVEAESTFGSTYVLKFSRAHLEPRKYQIAFDISYDQSETNSAATISAISGIQISPYPISLSIFTALSAILGAILKTSLVRAENIFQYIGEEVASGRMIIGPIVAVVLFNVYEHLSVGKEMSKISVGWRSALLIGVVSGLANDRIIKALNAFITGS